MSKSLVKLSFLKNEQWRVALVDSFCQAGKTKKCFELLDTKLKDERGNALVIFITQANSVASTNQTLQRAMMSEDITKHIPVGNITRSARVNKEGFVLGNYMIVDFWHAKNTDNILDFVQERHATFGSIIIVIDECEQGSLKGVNERLSFVRNVEKAAIRSSVKIVFVTATVANLSKSILHVAKADFKKFSNSRIISDVINERIVEHHFAEPHETYIGASWFMNTENVWKRLVFPKKTAELSKEQYNSLKEDVIMDTMGALPDAAKELTLIVTSTRTEDHRRLAGRLYESGYNVIVEMNGANNGAKNFRVNYRGDDGEYGTWDIPYKQIDLKADKGYLETYRNSEKEVVVSGITCKEDYTLSHVLQAALFMMTRVEKRIKESSDGSEYHKLEAISNGIESLDKDHKRPVDYPRHPKVALVAGHLAGRGITFQNPAIDFTCTSFCFTGTRDVVQRGASNTQRFGRACGYFMDVFAREGRKPILIATEGIMKDALANEAALREKASSVKNGSLICLKDFVSQADWERIVKNTKEVMKEKTKKPRKTYGGEDDVKVDGVSLRALKHYYGSKNLLIGKMIRYLYEQEGKVTFEEFKEGIGYEKTDKQFRDNIDNGRSINSKYGKLWSVQDDLYEINARVADILRTDK